MNRPVLQHWLAIALLPLAACTVRDPLYCDEAHRCEDPLRPFCDMLGEHPESGGIGRTCIADPTSGADASPADDDGGDVLADGGATDGAVATCTPRLAFVSDRDDNEEIYATNIDGTNQVNLTNDPAFDSDPQWAPDGTQIAFARDFRIWIMNADGSDQRQLTAGWTEGFLDARPTWSPDGTRIAFRRIIDDSVSEIWSISPAGGTPTNLMNAAVAGPFAWSPDGSTLAFATNRDDDFEIYAMNADGSDQTNLTNASLDDGSSDDGPVWFADGTRMLFVSRRNGHGDIWVMNADGTKPRNLTFSSFNITGVDLSPDQGTVVYAQDDTFGDLFLMNSDGSGQRQITYEAAVDKHPRFSPDGSKIAWSSYRDSNFEIYVMDADGTDPVRVTSNGYTTGDSSPVWRPCP